MCDSVCVFMQMKFMTLFVAVGRQTALTLGSFSVTTCNKEKKKKFFVVQGQYLSFDKILSLPEHLVLLFLQHRGF